MGKRLPNLSGACKPLSELNAAAAERKEQWTTDDTNRIVEIEIDKIDDFPDHPYQVRNDRDMKQLYESVREHGVMTPAIVTRKDDGRYEMVSGHRRKFAAQLADLSVIPCEVVELSHDDAVLYMVESNFHRSKLLPSEKAFAYKMRLEAMKRKSGRPAEKNSAPLEPNLKGTRSNEQLAAEAGESTAQIKRYIRLTYLLPKLLEMVDAQKLGFRPAVELSYLNEEEQNWLLDSMILEQVSPTLDQASRIKQLSADGNLSKDDITAILTASQKPEIAVFSLPRAKISKYFKKSAKQNEIEETIEKALKMYFDSLKS